MLKKIISLILIFLFTLCMVGCNAAINNNPVNTDTDSAKTCIQTNDYLVEQVKIDESLISEMQSGYSFDDPLVVVNPYGNAPLSAVIIFSTDESIGGNICVKGKSEEDNICGTFAAEKDHFVPVCGLYPGKSTEVVLTLDNGQTTALEIATEAVDLGLHDYSAQMHQAELYDDSTLTICGNMILHCYAGYDSKGDLRWAITNTGANAFTPIENGHFLIPNIYNHGAEFPNGLTGIREMDMLGKVYNTYVWDGGEHHEIIVMPDGNYMMTGSRPGYETNRDYVFEIDSKTGEVVWDLDIASIIRPGSSGCKNDKGEDWCHCNALAYDEKSGTLLISCRHLCAVVAVDYATGELRWILGDPAGWAEEYKPYLLRGIGTDFDWAYGQHQLTLLSDGNLLLFDNGEFGRVKAVNEADAIASEDNYSRAVIYHIDSIGQTVEKLWEYGREYGASCYAGSMSGIQCLDEEQRKYLICFGTCEEDEKALTHIKLIDHEQEVWQIDYEGSSTYRACRYDLYQDDSYDPYAVGSWLGDIGVTKQLEMNGVDLDATDNTLDGLAVDYFPFNALRFSGSVIVEDENLLTAYQVLLVNSSNEQYFYDLGYTTSNAENGKKVSFSRWISLNGLPSGEYDVFVVMNDHVYDLEKYIVIN